MNQSSLNEIINQEQIEAILKEFKEERQLRELKFYLLSFQSELKTIGVDASTLAWQIYTTYKNLNR